MKVKGSLHEAKAKIKEQDSKASGYRGLEEGGAAEKNGGKLEKKVRR
jgi:uncharacterized protein YjbJ (UPF0337 family)